MHLIKLCVGIDSVQELAAWQAMRLDRQRQTGLVPELAHRTRQTPRRREAVLEGGSIYWVIKGAIKARQRIVDLREEADDEGRTRCAIVLDPALIATRPQLRRPFQGWRYLKPEDAPADIGPAEDISDDMPEAMREELAELALI